MKNLDSYITEKLVIGKNIIHKKIKVSTRDELRAILEERLAEDKNADFNDLDVSEITDMGYDSCGLFEDLDPHNIKIDKWDVSNVKNMGYMFQFCENFNSDLSKWDVSKVQNMNEMFYECNRFNSNLSKWDVSNVKDMGYMFYNCEKFNSDLSKWDVSNVKDMDSMFRGCNSLKNKPSWY